MDTNNQANENALASKGTAGRYLAGLRQTLAERFDEGELRTLCFDLGIDYDDLPTEGRANKARELVSHLVRHGRVAELVEIGKRLRPNIPWEDVPAAIENGTFVLGTDFTQVSETRHEPGPSTGTTVTASGQGNVVAGRDIRAPVFSNIRDSVIKISSLPRGALLAVTLITVLTLAGVFFLVFENMRPSQLPSAPDPTLLETVESANMTVTALTVQKNDGQEMLWVGAQLEEENGLYQLNPKQRADAVFQHVLTVDEQITALTVDCQGNVWLLSRAGTLVYRPQTGEHTTLLNRTTTDEWLTKDTMHAIATRCTEDGAVEVWLGREGVHTLRYRGEYPFLDAVEFTPPEQDPVFKASQELDSVRALYYDAGDETLWAASMSGRLLSLSLKGVLEPAVTNESDTLWSLDQSPDGTVWAGGSQYLIHIGEEKPIPLLRDDGSPLGTGAFTIAAGPRWVWFGGGCADSNGDCQPLWVYVQGSLFPIDLGARKEVRDIVIDSAGTVWIGTEHGLILYPPNDK